MKTLITTAILSIAITSTSFASSYLNVKNVSHVDGNTQVTYEMINVEGKQTYSQATYGFTFKGDLSTQDVINRGSLLSYESITVQSKESGTISKKGQVNALGLLRYEAYKKNGLKGYYAELAKQTEAEGILTK